MNYLPLIMQTNLGVSASSTILNVYNSVSEPFQIHGTLSFIKQDSEIPKWLRS